MHEFYDTLEQIRELSRDLKEQYFSKIKDFSLADLDEVQENLADVTTDLKNIRVSCKMNMKNAGRRGM